MNEHNYFNSNCSGAKALAGQGNLLAIAGSSDNAVTLADVSDPSNPVLRASLKNGVAGYLNLAAPNALAIANNLLAIASESSNAVTLVDVTVPANPMLRASADAANWNYNDYGSTTAIEL